MHAVNGPVPVSPEMTVGFLGLLILLAGAVWLFVHWLLDAPARADPWGQDVTNDMEKDETVALCHRCLTPHNQLTHFCSNCGAPVGDYTNLLPFPYLFSIGHTLRIGTSGEYHRTPLTVFGFFLLGLAEYTILAPVYWFMLARRLTRIRDASEEKNLPQPPAIPE